MKRGRKPHNSNSSSKAKCLHIVKICALIMLLGFINYGCDKEDSHEYYVKYKINSTTVNTGGELNVIINSENNKQMTLIIDQNTKWEMTIGPVSKGFNAKIRGSNRTGTSQLRIYTEIQVSEDDRPFATKAFDGVWGNSSIFVNGMISEYTIG